VGKSGGKSASTAHKKPEHLSLVDIAYNVLVEAIVNQEYGPGAQISINSVANQLEISITPVREALMRAHGEGLVKQKTNHGFVVANILTPKELYDLFGVRHTLELYALDEAVISPEVIEELKDLLAQMYVARDGATYDHFKDYLQFDHDYHRAIVSMCNNHFLIKSWEDLHVHLHLSRLYTGIGLVDRTESVKEHEEIFAALQQNDTALAKTLLSAHIRQVPQRLQSLLPH
jgi:DNA-binding GntR family transcriptional regulator